jgi:hypothetical protein
MDKNTKEEYWYVYSKTGTSTYTSPSYVNKDRRDEFAQDLADNGWTVELFESIRRATGTMKPDPRAKLREAKVGSLWEKQRPDDLEPVRYVKIDNNKFMRIVGSSFTYPSVNGIGFPERLTQVDEF